MLRTSEKIVRVFFDLVDKGAYIFKHEEGGRLATDCTLYDRNGTYWVWSHKKHRYVKYKRLSDALDDIDKEVNNEIH